LKGEGTGVRVALWSVTALFVAVPFAAVELPPLADLPQHAAQVRLFGEAMDEGSPYAVQWGTPYSLLYLLLAASRELIAPWCGEIAAARAAAAAVTLLWVSALHLLAWRFSRPAAAAVAASMLAFSHVLYWGFLPFMIGFPLFALWVAALQREPAAATSGRRAARVASVTALAALLYLAHALWFAIALAWLAVDSWRQRRRGADSLGLAVRAAGPVLIAMLATAWFESISETSFATPPFWVSGWWWRRLLPGTWVEAAFGGLAGNVEALALAAIVLWLGLAVRGARRRLREQGDGTLALLGGLFFAAALVLPDKFVNTIEFHDRWMPPALAFLLLAAPPLRLPRNLARVLAVAVLAGFVTVTATVWRQVERHELAGLKPALAALPEVPRVLGLDFLRRSRWLDHQPFLQTFAWAQVVHGGELNFSFADFAPSPVVYSPPRQPPWTPGLEWYPQLVRPGDFGWFDHVLVRAPAPIHAQFAAAPFLEPVTPPAPWRLYRVGEDAPRTPFRPPTPRRRSTAPPAPTAPG
jgi:hypothetical protein